MTPARATRATERAAGLAAELAPRRAAGWAESLRELRHGLPLLVKDLTELAARRRTYLLRALYATVLFAIFAFWLKSGLAQAGRNPAAALGIGREFFMVLVGLQVAGVYLMVPTMVSGCVTEEKEKRTLELLFVTDLTPGEIVLQKLGGRVVPMLTLLLLSLPLMAVCYAFGGLSAEMVALSALVLVTTCVQVGAFAVMNSTRMRTTSEAVSRTYVHGIGYLFLAHIVGSVVMAVAAFRGFGRGGAVGFGPVTAILAGGAGFLPAGALIMLGSGGGFRWALLALVPAWLWTLRCLAKARESLVSHAFLPPKKRKRSFFGGLVRFARWQAARRRKSGVDDSSYLPGDEPILWRDTMNTYLEWPHGVRGMLVIVMTVLLLLAVPVALGSRWGDDSPVLSFLVAVCWILAAAVVLSRSSTLFAEERANRTLEVLLTTPLSGAEIVRQKAKVPWRLTLLVAVPMGTLFVIEALVEARLHRPGGVAAQLAYLGVSALAVFILLPALYWIALLAGLWIHNRTRASVVAMIALLAWNFGPSRVPYFVPLPRSLRAGIGAAMAWIGHASPWRIVSVAEEGFAPGYYGGYGALPDGLAPVLRGLAVNAVLLFLVRWLCLRNADRWLGRPAAPGRGAGEPAGGFPAEGGAA